MPTVGCQVGLLGLVLLGAACPRPGPAVIPAPTAPAPPASRPLTGEEEPFSPTPGPARPLGSPPFRLTLVADPLPGARLARLVAALRTNLERGGAFLLAADDERVGATLRVGPHAATLYLAPGTPGGPFERSFPLRGEPAHAARALATTLHRLYLDEPGPYFSRIAFIAGTGTSGAARHVFTINLDGSGVQRISDADHPNLLPAWSRAGDLVYTAFVGGSPALVLRPAGRGAPQVLAREYDLNTGAAFSPDGQHIAVSQSVEGNTDIFLLDRQGTVRRRLTDHPGIDISPSWSPSGAELVFVSDREGSPQVYRLSLSDAAIQRLTVDGSYNQEPDWCPRRGSRLVAYTHRHGGSRYEVHLLDADSGHSTRLTFDGGQNTGPSWSPDCRLLLYAAKGSGLWVISPDDRQRWQLFAGSARQPAWSAPLPAQLFE